MVENLRLEYKFKNLSLQKIMSSKTKIEQVQNNTHENDRKRNKLEKNIEFEEKRAKRKE